MSRLPETYRRIAVPPTKSWDCWVLSDHYESEVGTVGRHRTYLGGLLYRAKYRSDRSAMDELKTGVRHCVLQLRKFPPETNPLGRVTSLAAVPCNPPKIMSIPHELAQSIAVILNVPDISRSVTKTQVTTAAKSNPTLHPEAYQVDGRLDGQTVLLIDDLYHTGMTLESVASQLRAAGADRVVGLCVTKVYRGMTL